MSIHDVYDGSQVIAQSLDILDKYRVSLKVGEDFEEYRALLAEHRPDHDLGLPFDPEHQFMTPANAFWIAGFDHDGELIHTQAMRMIELGNSHLSDYMRENFLDFPPSGLPLDLKRSRYRPGPSAKRMTGRTVYHGEVWMGGTKGQFRGSGLSCVLGRFAFMSAMLRWSPDHFFGFMPRAVAFKGFAERQGYMHAEPAAARRLCRTRRPALANVGKRQSAGGVHGLDGERGCAPPDADATERTGAIARLDRGRKTPRTCRRLTAGS